MSGVQQQSSERIESAHLRIDHERPLRSVLQMHEVIEQGCVTHGHTNSQPFVDVVLQHRGGRKDPQERRW